MKQLHKQFKKEEVIEVFEKYLAKEIGINQTNEAIILSNWPNSNNEI